MKPTQKMSNSSKSSVSIQKKNNTIDYEFWYTCECAILLNGFLCREQSEFLLHFNVLLKFAVDWKSILCCFLKTILITCTYHYVTS